MAVSRTTEELYGRQARRFARWIAAEARDPEDHRSWVMALQGLAGHVARKSWRLYRNAITWHLAQSRGPAFQTAFLLASDTVPKPPERRRRLQRRIDPETLRTVVNGLRARRGRTGTRIADMLIAMVATGIRPNEWQSATRKGPGMLVVVNAKFRPPDGAMPGRGNGPVRELELDPAAVGQPVDDAIGRTIEWLRGRPWSGVSPNANRLFRTTIKSLVTAGHLTPQWLRVRIYDARHQFSADAKASLSLLAGEIAAAMGHASAVTAVTHYGKRSHAAGRSIVKPSARSVRAVSEASIAKARATTNRTQAALAKAARAATDQRTGAKNASRRPPSDIPVTR